jgi:hypothetical protein
MTMSRVSRIGFWLGLATILVGIAALWMLPDRTGLAILLQVGGGLVALIVGVVLRPQNDWSYGDPDPVDTSMPWEGDTYHIPPNGRQLHRLADQAERKRRRTFGGANPWE